MKTITFNRILEIREETLKNEISKLNPDNYYDNEKQKMLKNSLQECRYITKLYNEYQKEQLTEISNSDQNQLLLPFDF